MCVNGFQFNANRFLEYYRRQNHSHAAATPALSGLLQTEILDVCMYVR